MEVRPGDGLYLNGVKIRVKGVNRHVFHPDYGRTSSRTLSEEAVGLIKKLNMNAFRRGDARAARTLLDEASKPIDAYFSKPIELDDGRSSWSDWVIARLLYREARALVGE